MMRIERHMLRIGLTGLLGVAVCCVCPEAQAGGLNQPAPSDGTVRFAATVRERPLLALRAQETLCRQLLEEVAERSVEAWERLLDTGMGKAKVWRKPLPAASAEALAALRGKLVVLRGVIYPHNQFFGNGGDFISTAGQGGSACFVRVDGAEWEGLYGAIRRFRRELGPVFLNGGKWSVLARVESVGEENAMYDGRRAARPVNGWIVVPVALFVPGHVLAMRDADGQWRFSGESWVQEAKESAYTVRYVPDEVTPKGLMQIFVTAIREKHFDLFESCIAPERRRQTSAQREIDQHWLAHQAWLEECASVVFEVAAPLRRTYDERGRSVETVVLESRTLNIDGQSIASPGMHTLRRVAGGRWFIVDYEARL